MVLILASLLALTACNKNPDLQKREYFERGNQYVAAKKYREAIIEYLNAVQIDPRYGEARYSLAKAYEQAQDYPRAYAEFLRAADILPNDKELQLKVATLLLNAGQFEDARTHARKILETEPRNVEALLVLANATAGLKDLKGAVAQAEAAIKLDPTHSQVYSTLGQLQFASGNTAEAERAFKRAIEIAPKAIDPRLALANFYWGEQRPAEAEATLKDALEIDPANEVAHHALAVLYLVTNRAPEAESHLKAVAATSSRPEAKVGLADYYVRLRPPRFADAEQVLGDAALATVPAAQLEMAQLRFLQGKAGEAEQIVDAVLKTAPKNAAALAAKARLLLEQKKLDEALTRAREAVSADPDSAEAHFVLGSVYGAKKDVNAAIVEFKQVLRINPSASVALTELARLQLAAGQPADAAQLAAQALKGDPQNVKIRLVLLRSLIANMDLVQADAQARLVVKQYPNAAEAHTLLGRVALLKGADAEARKEFERALALDTESVEAVTGMVSLEMKQRQPAAARARVDAALAKQPTDGALLVLAAGVYGSIGDFQKTEEVLRKALEADSSNFQAYNMLAGLYVTEKRMDQALAQFEALAKVQPNAAWAHTMVANILVQQGKLEDAERRYEQALQIDPRASVAANNLAWLYAEAGKKLDVALQLAQTAKQVSPDWIQADDTLGWVYYKKGLGSLAVSSLKQSVAGQPTNPTYLYHLGLAYALSGDKSNARQSLERALQIAPTFDHAEDARKFLKSIA